MPANQSLHKIVTKEGSNPSAYKLDFKMELIDDLLRSKGIPAPVANAIAGVVGKNENVEWQLISASKDPEISSTGSPYAWDDKERYFFRYFNKTDENGYEVILEYSRLNSPFEIRGVAIKNSVISDARATDQKVREAITGMLLAILWSEGMDNYPSYANSFESIYRDNFSDVSKDDIAPYLASVYNTLKDNVDTTKVGIVAAPFALDNACLNGANNKLKRLLDGEQRIGFLCADTCIMNLASDAVVKIRYQSSVANEDVPFVEIMQPLTAARKIPKVDKIESNMYPVNPTREHTEDEISRMHEIPDWYIPVQRIVRFARNIAVSQIFERPVRNILLRGPAGCGKTEGAKAIASMCGLPYGVVTGHAEMEFFDLTSMLVPRTETGVNTPEELLEFLLHAVRNENMRLPSMSEISLYPIEVYKDVAGQVKEDATEADCFAALAAKLLSFCKADVSMFMGSQSKFKVVRSDLTIGMERGWLVEMQEMNTLLKPGTLVGLNNIMEHGSLQLPTGEIIRRHPDTVIVFTQNVGYAGTVEGNQSVYSRIELKADLKAPSEEEMVKRIQMHVPQLDTVDIRTIVQVSERIRNTCGQEIEGGSIGTREEIAWAKMTYLYEGNILEAAEDTILPACSEDEEAIDIVRQCILLAIAPDYA